MDLSKQKILLSNKKLLFMGIAFFLLTTILVTLFASKEIKIKLDEKEVAHSFRGNHTVGEVLKEAKISIVKEDKVKPSLTTVVEDGDKISIVKATPVTVTADNKEYKFLSTETEVQKLLQQLKIDIGNLDIVEPSIDSTIDGQEKQIKIVRVEEKYEINTEVLNYKDIVKDNDNMDKGKITLVQRGSNGEKTIKQKVVLYDGVETKREIVEESTTKEPVDEVKEVGTHIEEAVIEPVKEPVTKAEKSGSNTLIATSRGDDNHTETIDVVVTGYCSCPICVGSNSGNTTASGTKPTANRTVAASSNYEFGTKLQIEGLGGVYQVEDRGGAIQGNRIDVYFSSHNEALQFGKKTMKAHVVR